MRGTRWLLLVAIVAIVSALGLTYRAEKKAIREQTPPKPASLPDNLNSTAQDWTYTESSSKQTMVEVSAKDALEARDSSRVDLKGVTLKLHDKRGGTYDLVTSAAASYYKTDHRFYSDGEVEITLKVPETGQPKHQLITIKSSGVNFDTATGQADTDKPADFAFEHGTGHSTGAFYDPDTHQLHLKQDVVLDWKPVGPHAKPMKIEAGSLYYREADSEIWLKPWGRMTRDTSVIEGQDATIKLRDDGTGQKTIQSIEASKARGSDTYPKRKLQYSADLLHVNFNDDGVAEQIQGDGNAQLLETSEASETTVAGQHVYLRFEPREKESVLAAVTSTGDSVVTEKPLPAPGRQLADTHVLRSDTLDLKMRPDGREIESIVTRAPGTLEFLPNVPTQHHRVLNGNNMVIMYGPQNRVESFRATDVRTRTEPTAEEKKRNRGVSVTTSKELEARFDPKTSKMVSMQQSGNFTYDEGDRKARAARGTLDSDVLLLDTAARMSDATGSTSADRIRMDQRTGDFTAEGNVNSSRLPDKDRRKNSEMLSGDEPMHAQARKMDSSDRNRKLHYEGDVVMWQGANRIQADTVDLDRQKHTLVADGHVVTNLWEEPKPAAGAAHARPAAAPVLTEVHAPHLVYTDADRLALYTGGVSLSRPNLQVKSREIHAFLADSGADSRLEKAFADGDVHIHQISQGFTYDGTAEHSEYYTDEQKVILLGGMPRMARSDGSVTNGPGGLTYFANDDRLLVNGSDGKPANSRLVRKKKE